MLRQLNVRENRIVFEVKAILFKHIEQYKIVGLKFISKPDQGRVLLHYLKIFLQHIQVVVLKMTREEKEVSEFKSMSC